MAHKQCDECGGRSNEGSEYVYHLDHCTQNPEHVTHFTDDELKEKYMKAKQLSDLCWQEIERRRGG